MWKLSIRTILGHKRRLLSTVLSIVLGVSFLSGTYVFTVYPGGQPLNLPARYSFTYRRKGSDWLIVSHHSSLTPTPPAPPTAPAR